MNWEAISAISEIVGAIAVVATLGYLALQIRDSHRVAADTNRQTRASLVCEGVKELATNEKLRMTINKSTFGDGEVYRELAEKFDLTLDEASVNDYWFAYWIYIHWGQFNSSITDNDKRELESIIGVWYSMEPMRTYIDKSPLRGTFDSEFLTFIKDTIDAREIKAKKG